MEIIKLRLDQLKPYEKNAKLYRESGGKSKLR